MLKNLSIRTNLILLVAIPVIASMIITTIGIYYVNRISQDLTQSLYKVKSILVCKLPRIHQILC